MTTFPAAGYVSNNARTEGEIKTALEDIVAAAKQLGGGNAETELTIAAGNITPTTWIHRVDTEADAASDNLDNVLQTNMPDGSLLFLRVENAARVVTVRHNQGGTGQVSTTDGASVVLDNTRKYLVLQRKGTTWEELFRVMWPTPTVSAQGSILVATAAARLAELLIGASGTIPMSAGGTLAYSSVPNCNYLFNGSMERWGAGASAAPTGWTLTGAGGSVARDSTDKKIGSFAAQVTRAGTNVTLHQDVDTLADTGGGVAWWQGRRVTFGAWVRASSAAQARLQLNDGVGTTSGSDHTGGGAFEWLTVTRTLDAAATRVRPQFQVRVDGACEIDGAVLFASESADNFRPGIAMDRSVVSFGGRSDNVGGAQTLWLGPIGGGFRFIGAPVDTQMVEAEVTIAAPYAGIARNLRCLRENTTATTAAFTFRKATADTALTATIASGQRTASDVANEIEVAAGDEIAVKVVVGAAGAANEEYRATIEFERRP